jgi:hypothetical protein
MAGIVSPGNVENLDRELTEWLLRNGSLPVLHHSDVPLPALQLAIVAVGLAHEASFTAKPLSHPSVADLLLAALAHRGRWP